MFEIGRLTRLDLGVVGENDTREIQIDVSEWLEKWPEAAIVIDVQKPDESYYPAATDVENGVLKWRVMASDVQIAGRGIAQIRAMDFQTRKIYKSRVVQTIIKESIDEKVDEDAPDPFETWVAQSVEAMHNTQNARNEAQAAAGAAEASAEAASENEKEAEAAKQIAVEAAAGAEKDAEAAINASNTAKTAATEAGSSAAAAEAAQIAATMAEQNAETAADVASSSASTAVGARKETVEAKAATITARNEAKAAAQQASAAAASAASNAGSAISAASRASSAAESANNDAEDAQSAANAANAEAKNAEASAAAAQEAETGAKAAEEAAVKAAREAAEDVRQSVADDAETAQQAARQAEGHAQAAQNVLDSIPAEYTVLADQVERNTLGILIKAPAIYADASGKLVTVKDAAALQSSSVVSTIKPTVDGVSAVTLTRTGRNMVSNLDYIVQNGHSNTVITADVIDVKSPTKFDYGRIPITFKAGVTYTLVIDWEVYGRGDAESGNARASYYVGMVGTAATNVFIAGNGSKRIVRQYTFAEDTVGRISWCPNQDGDVAARSRSRIMLLDGAYTADNAPEFVPCDKQTLTASLPETVYGGTLDWTTGLLTITHGADGAEMAEHRTIQLDPQTLEMLKGHNAVWSDTGDTSLVYVADTKLYIDNAVAAIATAIINN